MPLFKDLGKKAGEVLTDDYCSDIKAEVKSVTKDGVKFTTAVTRKNDDGSVLGSLKNTWKCCDWATLNTTLDTNGKTETEVSMEKFADGLKATVNINLADNKHKAGIEYVSDMFGVTASTEVSNPADFSASVCVGSGGINVGVETKGGNLDKTSGTAQYKADDYTASLACSDRGDKLTFRYLHNVSSKTTAAAEYALERSKAKHLVTLGLSQKCTANCAARAKINSEGLASVVATFRCCPNAQLRLSAAIDTTNLAKPNHKVGLQLLSEL